MRSSDRYKIYKNLIYFIYLYIENWNQSDIMKSEIEKEIAGIDKDIEEALSSMSESERKEFEKKMVALDKELKKKFADEI